MNFVKSIRQFLKEKKVANDSIDKVVSKAIQDNDPEDCNSAVSDAWETDIEFLDGMSTGTARFILERKVNKDVLEQYGVKNIENHGRHYLAKIVGPDGNVTDTVIIDKLSRSVHFLKGKFK
jgi:hypothetical protein